MWNFSGVCHRNIEKSGNPGDAYAQQQRSTARPSHFPAFQQLDHRKGTIASVCVLESILGENITGIIARDSTDHYEKARHVATR
jgi:hypothetical protein